MHYLNFDVGDSGDGVTTLEALASTGAAEHAAVLREAQAVLDWAWARYPEGHGRLDDGADWDHDLQVHAEPGGWQAVALTITATDRFAADFIARFGPFDDDAA